MNDKMLVFVTHNKGKIESANKYFGGIVSFQTYDYDFKEIRSDDVEEVAIAKVLEAYAVTKKPTIALDAGFYVKSLNGFQGVYVHHFLDTIGISGLLKLMAGVEDRRCCFRQCLAYYDGLGKPKVFYGEHRGTVNYESKGTLSEDDWSEISYIFVPTGLDKTLAEMTKEERILLSKENDRESAFQKFKEWYIDYLKAERYTQETMLKHGWEKTCEYIKSNDLVVDISYRTWIEPLWIVGCVEDLIIFKYEDIAPSITQKETVRYIKNKYGKLILEAYNQCNKTDYTHIEIKY